MTRKYAYINQKLYIGQALKRLGISGCTRLPRLTLVYHRPGAPIGYLLLKVFIDALEARLGDHVELVEVNDAELIDSEKILVLLPCRGGHWHHLLNRVKVGKIARLPPTVIAMVFARSARARGVEKMALCYLKARRFREEQDEDIRAIVATLKHFGIEAKTLALDSMEPPKKETAVMQLEGYAVAPLAIFPGKLTETCHSILKGVRLGPLLVEGFDILLEWAYKVAREQHARPCGHYVWMI